jgi:hypothetical protein
MISNYSRVVTILSNIEDNSRVYRKKTTKRNQGLYWKDSYNPVVVAGHVDRLGGLLFWPAPLRGFSPNCRTVTLVNTSTVTIILCYCIILVIVYTIRLDLNIGSFLSIGLLSYCCECFRAVQNNQYSID